MARFNEMAAHELLPKIKSGEVTAEAVTRDVLERITAEDHRIHAYLAIQPKAALDMARILDRNWDTG